MESNLSSNFETLIFGASGKRIKEKIEVFEAHNDSL